MQLPLYRLIRICIRLTAILANQGPTMPLTFLHYIYHIIPAIRIFLHVIKRRLEHSMDFKFSENILSFNIV